MSVDTASSKPKNIPWQRIEVIQVFRLYCQLPFGKMHKGNPLVVDLAHRLGRTPSAVALKLVNLASFDPSLQARGIRGAANASKLDRQIWEEFQHDAEALVTEAEKVSDLALLETPQSPTETWLEQRVRLGQQFFRRSLLGLYQGKCCLTRIENPALLVASHILPWATHPAERVLPCNGLLLNAFHDRLFDRGWMTLDEQYRANFSSEVRQMGIPSAWTEPYIGQTIFLPDKFAPSQEYLDYHRTRLFIN